MGGYSYAPPDAGADPSTMSGQLDEVLQKSPIPPMKEPHTTHKRAPYHP